MTACRIEVKFAKKDLMRFISHLDLMRLFSRASRRASIPLELTKGFNPHPKISIRRALKLGLTSEDEEATFYLSRRMGPEEFRKLFQEQLPDGIEIIKAVEQEV